MISWIVMALAGGCPVILALSLLLVLWRRCFHRKGHAAADADTEAVPDGRLQMLASGISRIHQVIPQNHLDNLAGDLQKRNSDHRFFSWSDHPTLITDAVESGWSRFAFTTFVTSPVKSGPSILGLRGNENKVETGWEIWKGSDDYLQKIRFNPGLQKIVTGPNSPVSAIRAALPLPGPPLENSAFPQEAYFEITILPRDENDEQSERETIKLIRDDSHHRNNNMPDGLASQSSGRGSSHGHKRSVIEEVRNEEILLSVGLTGGGTLHLKIPGSFPGSIGFNSSGSVYLDGKTLVSESEEDEWVSGVEKVIGCGYNPGQKTVYFTVDSQMAHIVRCKMAPFGSPLYPTLAAHADVTVFVNLGQSPLRFAPANARRTPNPCFTEPTPLTYEDSKELFSMGRIDSNWRQRSKRNAVNCSKDLESEDDDLFEIHLDRRPNC